MRLTINLDGELTLGELRMLVNTTRHMSDSTEVEYCRADLNTPDDVPDFLSVSMTTADRDKDGDCPKCGTHNPLPKKTVRVKGARRYYVCSKCGQDWSTIETEGK